MTMLSLTFVVLLAIGITPTLAISKSDKQGLKSMHFTLYQHDIFNKTDFIIVQGVGGASSSLPKPPIGTIVVLKDPLTETQDPSSKVLGMVEEMAITSSFDGLDNISIGRFNLNLNGHKGTISFLGVVNNLKPSDYPVVGGTGDFLFVQGYVTSSLLSLKNLTFVYQQEFNLFWPPYAAHAI